MKPILFLVAACLTCLMLGGCDTLVLTHPVGRPATDSQTQTLEGTWRNSGTDAASVQIKHIQANELRIAGTEWNEKTKQFELKQLTLFLTTDEDVFYANLVMDEPAPKPDQPRYQFARLARLTDKDVLVIYPPQSDAFAKAVSTGVLSGSVINPPQGEFGKMITIDATSDQLAQFIDPKKIGEQFDVNSPIVLIRQSKPSEREQGDEKK